MTNLKTINALEDAMDCVESLKGDKWHTGGSLELGGGALVSGSDGSSDFASILCALIVMDSVDLSKYKDRDEIIEQYFVTQSFNGKLKAAQHIKIEANRLVQNIEFLCSYFDYGTSLKPLYQLAGKQSLQFTKEYLESLILSKPLSPIVLSTLLKPGKYDPILADLFRFHINKSNEHGYVGIYIDEKQENLGYLSGRILATMELIKSLSQSTEPLRIDYARFSVSSIPMLPKLSMIVKKYIYTVPNLGKQMFLKSLIDSLIEMAKANVGTKKYLSDNEQAMFAIGYKQQQEYFADDEFTSKFPVMLPKGA